MLLPYDCVTFAEIPEMQAENEKMFAFIPSVFAVSEEMQTARRITPAPDYCGK